jgi:hypothetical protein
MSLENLQIQKSMRNNSSRNIFVAMRRHKQTDKKENFVVEPSGGGK